MAPETKRNGKVDEQIEETFPASDPPSFMGGETLGAPAGRHTPRRSAPAPKRRKPAKKAKTANRKRAAKKKKRATKKRKPR
ncbi:MAG: hypothetical protein JSR55_02660 [Proteobacteria bacterium]|nr:hypothetical protein [Pseudomonadota bacterium]